MPHFSETPGVETSFAGGKRQNELQDAHIDLEETLQELAWRASEGDRVAGEELEEFYWEQDVLFDDNPINDNPTFRRIDRTEQPEEPVYGFSRFDNTDFN